MTKIDRYQGWINHKNYGAINDHQKNECIIEFKNIPKEKKDKLLNACLNILNEEDVISVSTIRKNIRKSMQTH